MNKNEYLNEKKMNKNENWNPQHPDKKAMR